MICSTAGFRRRLSGALQEHFYNKLDNFFHGAIAPSGSGPPHFRNLTITLTPHSVGLLWTSDQSVADIST